MGVAQIGGNTVATTSVNPDGTYSVSFYGPTTPGSYPEVVTYTPAPGSNTGGGSFSTTLSVGSGSGSANPGLTITFGNGASSGAQQQLCGGAQGRPAGCFCDPHACRKHACFAHAKQMLLAQACIAMPSRCCLLRLHCHAGSVLRI